MKTNKYLRNHFFVTLLFSLFAWGGWEFFGRTFEEASIQGEVPTFLELAPFYLLLLTAFYAGCVGNSFLNCLLHSFIITVVVIGLSIPFSALFGLHYAHDMWVGDPGFIKSALLELLVLFTLTAIVVEAVYLARILRRKLRHSV